MTCGIIALGVAAVVAVKKEYFVDRCKRSEKFARTIFTVAIGLCILVAILITKQPL